MFSALSQIAKHSVDLAEMVVEAEIFPAVLTGLKDHDEYVKKNVATLIREIAKHTPEVGGAVDIWYTGAQWTVFFGLSVEGCLLVLVYLQLVYLLFVKMCLAYL